MAKTAAAPATDQGERQPLIISLVFFVLTTIGLGVFCYVLYSDQKAKDEAVAKAANDVKAARGEAKDWENVAKVNRVFAGTAEAGDRDILGDIKEGGGDKASAEVERLKGAARAQAAASAKAAAGPKGDPKAGGADDFGAVWPGSSLIDLAVKSRVERDLALRQAKADRDAYDGAVKRMADVSEAYQEARKAFEKSSVELPKTFQLKMQEIQDLSDERTKAYTASQGVFRSENEKLQEERAKLTDDKRLAEDNAKKLRTEVTDLSKRIKTPDQFQYDQPLGKVTRRLPDRTVEIDLGSADRVKEGLVFSVLPADFPQKGRQSRVRQFREPDARGNYQTVERFVPKGTLEVTQVLGPNLSRARLTGEADDIRDAVLTGDLLYNAVWRKGDVDHVALVGIFDVNGDGTDDTEAVVRDLRRMGIPVDAVYDLRTLKWNGQITQRTRYLVEGYTPTNSGNDPNQAAKTKLIGAISAAKEEARNKAIPVVKLQDFFGRMGYRVTPNVSDERVNQATVRYLTGVGTIEAPKDEGN